MRRARRGSNPLRSDGNERITCRHRTRAGPGRRRLWIRPWLACDAVAISVMARPIARLACVCGRQADCPRRIAVRKGREMPKRRHRRPGRQDEQPPSGDGDDDGDRDDDSRAPIKPTQEHHTLMTTGDRAEAPIDAVQLDFGVALVGRVASGTRMGESAVEPQIATGWLIATASATLRFSGQVASPEKQPRPQSMGGKQGRRARLDLAPNGMACPAGIEPATL